MIFTLGKNIFIANCLLFFLIGSPFVSYAFEGKDTCAPRDLADVARSLFNISKPKKEKSSAIFVAPVFNSSPTTGFVFGVTGQGAFQSPGSKMSAFQCNIQYTTKNQILIFLRNNIYMNKNKIFLSGDWRYFKYSEATYGLGTNAPEGSIVNKINFNGQTMPTDSLAQPMKFNYFKLHQTASWLITNNFYIGPGIHLDTYNNIEDLKLDTLSSPKKYTSHYIYSVKHGFNTTHYTMMGVSLNLMYDTRDNMVNTEKGIFANVNFRTNPTWLGSDKSSTILWTEFRAFKKIIPNKPQHVLGVWLMGNFVTGGDVPYLALPAIGYDQRSKSGRGYTNGRFRGEQLIDLEAEYRFPIMCNQLISGVVFGSAITTSNKDVNVNLFDYLRPAGGVGLRFLFNKKAKMNMQIDYAIGQNSSGFYFGASEVF